MQNASLMAVEEALARLLTQAERHSILETEKVPLAEADGRVLRTAVAAALDVPPWPNSAMDGYALRVGDCAGEPLRVSQTIFAGYSPEPLEAGTCARIFTGAPLPAGADCVEMQENVEVLPDGRVCFLKGVQARQHVRPQGGEARQGDVLLEAGTRLGPFELGVAATAGIAELVVVRRPRVALLSTGDELVEPGQALAPGQIFNSNRALLRSWLQRLGCSVQVLRVLKDDPAAIRACLDRLSNVDLILSTGGVSVGEADYLGQVLREAGELTFWKLAIKPGKPLTCGHYRDVPFIGLPGNPASGLVTFGLLARPYLLRRLGVQVVEPLALQVAAGFEWPVAGTRREYLRARLVDGKAVLFGNQSSAVLRSAVWADGLVEVPERQTLQAGDCVRFIPFSELLA